MYYCAIVLWCLLGLLTRGHATPSSCSLDPISLPWANVTLDGIAVNRGIDIQLAGQPVSLRATTILSNTRIRNARDCEFGNSSAQSGCQGASGSTFSIEKSPTWVTAAQGTWNVTAMDAPDVGETVIDGYDVAKFYGLPEIPGFPVEIWSDTSSDNKSGLSLGPNSSFINTLLDVEAIPSIVWGLFFGSRSQSKGVDGNLTLGGYDKARIAGPWSNFTISANYINNPCPLQVMVKDIRLNNDRGSFSLFADSDATVVACVDPLQNQFTFTEKMYDLFANLTDHPVNPAMAGGTNFTQQTYPVANEPLIGNLTVELSNGYTTIIPHYEFVSQERGTDAEGKYSVVNESRIMVAAGTTGTSTLDGVEVPILGGVFLAMNYLFVDYPNGLFHLAPAVVGELGDQDHDVVKVCGAQSFDQSMTNSSHAKSSSNAGAIAGGVVGGLAVIAIAYLAFWYLRRRNRLRSVEQTISSKEVDGSGTDAPEVYASNLANTEHWLNECAPPHAPGSELEGTTATLAGRSMSEPKAAISPLSDRRSPWPEEPIPHVQERMGISDSISRPERRESELEGNQSVNRRESELEAIPSTSPRRESELEGNNVWR